MRIPFCRLFDDRGFAKMTAFHGDAPAALTDVFHGCQFVLANMGDINIRCTAKTAIGFISAGITQVARIICDSSAIFTCVCHGASPFQLELNALYKNQSLNYIKMKNFSVNAVLSKITYS
jgi:hypothetical protein